MHVHILKETRKILKPIMEEIYSIVFLTLAIVLLPFQTLAQTTEGSVGSEPPADGGVPTSGFTTESDITLIATITADGSKIASVNESTQTTGTTELSIESVVFPLAGLRVWHIAGLVICAVLIIIVVVCCRVDFRIPRSNQAIDDDDRKRSENKKYIKQLDSAIYSELRLPNAPQLVVER